MSLLSAIELLELVEQGVIENVERSAINAASIDLHLGYKFLLEGMPHPTNCTVDLSKRESPYMYEVLEEVILQPGQFCLSATKEIFHLPDNISAQFILKSSMARAGLEHSMAGWCLTGDTLIPCLDGTVKQIKDIQAGEYVYSLDKEGSVQPGLVEKSFVSNRVTEVLDVTLDNGETFSCTENHLIMTRGGCYVKASNLIHKMALMPFYPDHPKQPTIRVQSVTKRTFESEIPVYDLTIKDHHNFALEVGCFVHNCDASWYGSALTLELTNLLKNHVLRLESGMAIGQMIFFKHTPVPEEFLYRNKGRYNNDRSVQQIKL